MAVVDIGTNSTRLFVADVEDGRRPSRIERQQPRDPDSAAGSTSQEAVGRGGRGHLRGNRRLRGDLRFAQVEVVDAIATSAVRDAENGDAFVAELRERFAISARVLDGEEEARLTYLGATAERPPSEPTLVIDIGGGSTELIVGRGEVIGFHTSLQAGVVRHTERHIADDPPTTSELEALGGRHPIPDRGRGRRPARGFGRRGGSPSPAPRPRSQPSISASTPTTPNGSTGTFSPSR